MRYNLITGKKEGVKKNCKDKYFQSSNANLLTGSTLIKIVLLANWFLVFLLDFFFYEPLCSLWRMPKYTDPIRTDGGSRVVGQNDNVGPHAERKRARAELGINLEMTTQKKCVPEGLGKEIFLHVRLVLRNGLCEHNMLSLSTGVGCASSTLALLRGCRNEVGLFFCLFFFFHFWHLIHNCKEKETNKNKGP